MEKQAVTKALAYASACAVLLDIGRGDIFAATGLAYLLWNLILAWIPYLMSLYWMKKDAPIAQFVPIFILWLLFFPNAPYMVTDIIHVASPLPHVLWYDSLVFFYFAAVGLFLGIASLSHVHEYLRAHMKKLWVSELAVFSICALTSFGIYLGRFERWNSWDFFVHPRELVRHSYAISTNLGHPSTPLFFMAVFTLCMYATYKILSVF